MEGGKDRVKRSFILFKKVSDNYRNRYSSRQPWKVIGRLKRLFERVKYTALSVAYTQAKSSPELIYQVASVETIAMKQGDAYFVSKPINMRWKIRCKNLGENCQKNNS